MTIKLKPCPFCGGAGEIHAWKPDPEDSFITYMRYQIVCTECSAQGPSFSKLGGIDPEKRAIKRWNKRVRKNVVF